MSAFYWNFALGYMQLWRLSRTDFGHSGLQLSLAVLQGKQQKLCERHCLQIS